MCICLFALTHIYHLILCIRVIATFKSAFVPQSSGAQCYLRSKLEEDLAVVVAGQNSDVAG